MTEADWWRPYWINGDRCRAMQVLIVEHAACVVCRRLTRWLDLCGDLGHCCSRRCHDVVFGDRQ